MKIEFVRAEIKRMRIQIKRPLPKLGCRIAAYAAGLLVFGARLGARWRIEKEWRPYGQIGLTISRLFIIQVERKAMSESGTILDLASGRMNVRS